jgi:hypothetical protein
MRGSEFAHECVWSSVAVFELSRRRISIAKTGVHRDPWLRVHQFAEPDELVHPKVIVLDARPGGVRARRTPVAIADPIAPVVAADEIAAGPAVDRGVELAQERERVGAQALDMIGRHQRKGPHRDRAFDHLELEPGLVRRRPCGELERQLAILVAHATQTNGLPIGLAFTPTQDHFDGTPFFRGPLEPNVTFVGLTGGDAKIVLPDGRARLDFRGVPAHKRFRCVHHD